MEYKDKQKGKTAGKKGGSLPASPTEKSDESLMVGFFIIFHSTIVPRSSKQARSLLKLHFLLALSTLIDAFNLHSCC